MNFEAVVCESMVSEDGCGEAAKEDERRNGKSRDLEEPKGSNNLRRPEEEEDEEIIGEERGECKF